MKMEIPLTDSIIARANGGDRDAQNELILHCRPLIRLVAERRMRRAYQSRFDASDVVQMTCMEAYSSYASFRGSSIPELFGWLKTILERKLWDMGPASRVINGETALLVATALEQLPTDYRKALELRFIHGLKIREIAQQLETTLGCVAGLLRRGVQLLYEQLPVGLLPSGDGHEDRGADHVE